MKSKQIKWIAAVLIFLATTGWAWWQLKPKNKEIPQQEINIKQAEIPQAETVTYEDWSGFKFDYPDILTIKEVELDNPEVYSSLEISGTDGKRLMIRVSDTQMTDLVEWQKSFNRQNSVRKIDQTTLADLPGLKLQYGAPEMMLTVVIDSGVIYEIKNQADTGFWDRTHNDLVAGWQFTASAATNTAGGAGTNEAVTLVEETVE
ncbi:hypothetical protein COW80_04995 [Candidatus Beckwithbacteria bacterium CG22_combo_CG10-13_8_21_14_all_01_47_9]|uniref:Uncharacterized protein n=4 Tax=Candidatus Beckwithiibacteriota TaxID=1752726 RepID=A0A2H0DZG9_9BACT|nr:MAG: hypothetical protein AUJ59_02195 [Candidatus Beckwithbacteria bacterium CG1_02_47_37]PIP87584.1 MAG: hypothetical protein COW80_04995 [Candidatus Beckwithbacteria bacterium CG22_combo_CG10-13_8_21_14_all_01_47_9]PJA23205.1 MAG: hypothetical protein COX59_01080 [Candidatus Beckwithbacteria bacterium CG_4_10_14_0_2_um_filter_47_25]PJC66125.1 MAG: hypothetical protein CO018_03610 [Candidatus Beckwithbacteria bacterium CG_4_9_14_0_2_um_filter_47_11]